MGNDGARMRGCETDHAGVFISLVNQHAVLARSPIIIVRRWGGKGMGDEDVTGHAAVLISLAKQHASKNDAQSSHFRDEG